MEVFSCAIEIVSLERNRVLDVDYLTAQNTNIGVYCYFRCITTV